MGYIVCLGCYLTQLRVFSDALWIRCTVCIEYSPIYLNYLKPWTCVYLRYTFGTALRDTRTVGRYNYISRKNAHSSHVLFGPINLIHTLHILYVHFSYTGNDRIAYSCSSVSDAIQKNVSKWIKSVDMVSQNWIDIDAGYDLFSKCADQLPEPISPAAQM